MSEAHSINRKKAFNMLFFIEFWERFGYYGLQAVLAMFFVKALNMDDAQSFVVFGAFSAMVYGYVSIGGYIGDKVLGTQRTIALGAIVLMIGYAMMAFAAAGDPVEESLVFLALGVIACGNGIFKANPSSLLSKIYEGDEQHLDSAFTMYYMSVNIGSFFSMLLVPIVGASYGLSLGFSICAMGLVAAIGGFFGFRYLVRGVDSPVGKKPLSAKKMGLTVAGVVLMSLFSAWMLDHLEVAHMLLLVIGLLVYGVFLKMIFQSRGAERSKMIAALILIAEAIVFFTLYQQMPTSLNFFAINNVEHSILGMFLSACSFLLLGASAGFASEAGIVSAWWMVGSYFLSSIGELLVSGLGLSMISKLVPQRLLGFLMGAWFLTTSIAAVLGGKVATFTAVPEGMTDAVETIGIYTGVFTKIGMATLGVTLVMAILVPVLNRLINKTDEAENPSGNL